MEMNLFKSKVEKMLMPFLIVLIYQRIMVKISRKYHVDKFPRLFLSPRLFLFVYFVYYGFTDID